MEKVWKKVNQGLSSKKYNKSSSTDVGYGFGEPQNVAAVAQIPPLSQGNPSSMERRRRRRRKSRPRRESFSAHNSNVSGQSKDKSGHEHIPLPPVPGTSEQSLRQRAVARLKMFNFHISWDLQMSQCKPCGSKPGNIITRRLQRNRRRGTENELYRSNSFKFERFERREEGDLDSNTQWRRQVSVCDEYSLPIDFVKKRPCSFDPCLADSLTDPWNKSSPLSEHVLFVDKVLQPEKLDEDISFGATTYLLSGRTILPKPGQLVKIQESDFKVLRAKDIFEHCSDSSVPPKSSEDEEDKSSKATELNSPDSISEDIVLSFATTKKSPKRVTLVEGAKRNPSPYYYADLLNNAKENSLCKPKENTVPYRKSNSFDAPGNEKDCIGFKRYSITEAGVRIIRCDTVSSTTSEYSNCSECKKLKDWHAQELAKVQATCNVKVDEKSEVPIQCIGDDEELFHPRPAVSIELVCTLNEAITDDMNGVRQIYETAFDSKVAPGDNELDEVERIARNSHLFPIETDAVMVTPVSYIRAKRSESKKSKNSKNQAKQDAISITPTATLSQELDDLCLNGSSKTESSSHLPLRGYTPTPPSTAPLPLKFPLKHERLFINSIKSAPNLPSTNPAVHPRLNSLRMDEKESTGSSDGSINDSSCNSPRKVERPKSVAGTSRINEIKRSHHVKIKGKNFSSTESIISSGGSMDSLRSSTSEGNRSTTSTESRQSSSLSSHESDSGTNILYPLRAQVLLHTKLHILSPISDKSSLEPGSETPDVAKGNSAKQTPEELELDEPDTVNQRKRLLPSSALLGIGNAEIQGSDSGISIHSARDGNPKLALPSYILQKRGVEVETKEEDGAIYLPQDIKDLPFDMPKLRRRKTLLEQDPCTSGGSATSIDFGDLPFDMPKLRRRLRNSQGQLDGVKHTSTESSCISQASSSHSMRDERIQTGSTTFRQNLTLNLNDHKTAVTKKFGTMDSKETSSNRALNLSLGITAHSVDIIDVNLPLERQNWYHGGISRIEAENILRNLSEGSFLVRNSESTRQDFSLSLKSAKGFMHMRIQRGMENNKFILGQFSRPFDTIPEMIRHFCLNRLPVRGAEHMCLIEPVVSQIL